MAVRELTKRLDAEGIHAPKTAAIAINNGCDAVVTRNGTDFKLIERLTGLKAEVYRLD